MFASMCCVDSQVPGGGAGGRGGCGVLACLQYCSGGQWGPHGGITGEDRSMKQIDVDTVVVYLLLSHHICVQVF